MGLRKPRQGRRPLLCVLEGRSRGGRCGQVWSRGAGPTAPGAVTFACRSLRLSLSRSVLKAQGPDALPDAPVQSLAASQRRQVSERSDGRRVDAKLTWGGCSSCGRAFASCGFCNNVSPAWWLKAIVRILSPSWRPVCNVRVSWATLPPKGSERILPGLSSGVWWSQVFLPHVVTSPLPQPPSSREFSCVCVFSSSVPYKDTRHWTWGPPRASRTISSRDP